ncbi:MAG: hypothetical protein EOO45_19245, partial [Flavobacterium sp.]
MKKIILTAISCMLLALTSCSEDTTTFSDTQESTNGISGNAYRSGLLNGVVGEVINGEMVVTADKAVLLKDFEEMLYADGISTTLKTIEIVKKVAENDESDSAFMLVASDKDGLSIGLWLTLNNNMFSRDRDLGTGDGTGTVCRGCATGCNLSYLKIDGKRIAYCNENGCV